MNAGKVLAILIALAGIVSIGTSRYIMTQVEQGKLEIASGQSKVDSANSLFSLNPLTEKYGKTFTESGQNRINQGKLDVERYSEMARWLKIGGIVLLVVGLGVFLISRKK